MTATFSLFRLPVLLSLVLAAFFPSPPQASQLSSPFEWTPLGIEGPAVQTLAVDPANSNRIYAGTEIGIYRSTDRGLTWTAMNNGLVTYYGDIPVVTAIAVDPSNPLILFMGTNSGGVFKSTNGGGSWQEINQGLVTLSIGYLLIDPYATSTVYAGTLGFDSLGGVYKSTNGGQSWTLASSNIPSPAYIYALAADPAIPNLLYVAEGRRGVYQSTDGGATWNLVLSTGNEGYGVRSLALDPDQPNVLYAGGFFGLIFRVEPDEPSGTVIKSGPPYSIVTSLMATGSNDVYAGFEGDGVLKSADGGDWVSASGGLTSSYVRAMAASVGQDTVLLSATDGGVFASADGAGSWTPCSHGLPFANVDILVKDPQNPNVIYSAVQGGGVFKSVDSGSTWNPASTGITDTWVWSLAVHPNFANVLYAGTFEDGFFISTDGGASWSASNTGLIQIPQHYSPVHAIAIDPESPQTIYVSLQSLSSLIPGGVFRSLDGGSSWDRLTHGFFHPDDVAFSLIIDPQNPQTLYAAGSMGIAKSDNGGLGWTPINQGLNHPYALRIFLSPEHPSILYASTESGFFKSTNAGSSWQATPLPYTVLALAVDEQNPTILYAGTEGWGVLRSVDQGESWAEFNGGFGFPYGRNYIDALIWMSDPRKSLFAGTPEGVYTISIPLRVFVPLVVRG